jgi:hypothetical protein
VATGKLQSKQTLDKHPPRLRAYQLDVIAIETPGQETDDVIITLIKDPKSHRAQKSASSRHSRPSARRSMQRRSSWIAKKGWWEGLVDSGVSRVSAAGGERARFVVSSRYISLLLRVIAAMMRHPSPLLHFTPQSVGSRHERALVARRARDARRYGRRGSSHLTRTAPMSRDGWRVHRRGA